MSRRSPKHKIVKTRNDTLGAYSIYFGKKKERGPCLVSKELRVVQHTFFPLLVVFLGKGDFGCGGFRSYFLPNGFRRSSLPSACPGHTQNTCCRSCHVALETFWIRNAKTEVRKESRCLGRQFITGSKHLSTGKCKYRNRLIADGASLRLENPCQHWTCHVPSRSFSRHSWVKIPWSSQNTQDSMHEKRPTWHKLGHLRGLTCV